MQHREPRSRSWRLCVCDSRGFVCFKILVATVDNTLIGFPLNYGACLRTCTPSLHHCSRRSMRSDERFVRPRERWLARKAAPTSPQAGGWPSMIAGSLSGRGRIGPRTPGVEPILGQTLHRGFQGSCGFVQLRICTVGCGPSGRSHMLPRQCRRWRSAGPIRSSALAPTTASRNLDLVFDGCRRGLWLAAG
jgi:hypothetical protein